MTMSIEAPHGAEQDEAELRREGARIAQLIDDLGALGGAPVRQRAQELVQRLVHLYGVGLERLLAIVGADRLDDGGRSRLRADPLVSSLLVLHGIHPDPSAAQDYDPDGAPAGHVRGPRAASGLVQINLDRGPAAKTGGGP